MIDRLRILGLASAAALGAMATVALLVGEGTVSAALTAVGTVAALSSLK